MVAVRRIVLDVLKPHEPELVRFGERLADLDGVDAVNVAVIEIDREVQNVKLTLEGEALEYESIQDAIQDLGATVHSVDEVACGEYPITEQRDTTPRRSTWLR